MPQPKSSRSAASRKPAARKPAAKKPAARKAGTAKAAAKPASSRSAAAKKPAAKKPAARRTTTAAAGKATAAARKPATAARKPAAAKRAPARKPAASRTADLRANVTAVRERLSQGVLITPDRLQEAVDDAVKNAHMTRQHAEEFVQNLLSNGRQQTQDFLADLEQLIGRSRRDLETAATDARRQAVRRSDRVLKQVDRGRRRATPSAFPILGYDDLTAAQVVDRVADLTPAQLRKVRDHEARGANRKSVLAAVERRLK